MGITTKESRRLFKFGDKVVPNLVPYDDFLVVVGCKGRGVLCRDRRDTLMEFLPAEIERYTP